MPKRVHPPELKAFEKWMREHDITVVEDAIEIRAFADDNAAITDGRPHYAVFAKRDLEVGEDVCLIKKSAVLSIRNTGIADIIAEEELVGGLALNFALMFELALGQESHWDGYLGILPEREPLPVFWADGELEYLRGTELANTVTTDKECMLEDYNEHLLPIIKNDKRLKKRLQGCNKDAMSFEAFLRAASLAASRAFYVDSYHGEAMVPMADMFNHRTLAENVHIEGDSDEELEDDDADDQGGSGHAGHGDDDSCGDCQVRRIAHYEELVIGVVRAAKKGDEVFNTFGEHGNGALVHKYGFAEANNPLDIVNVDADIVSSVIGFSLQPSDTDDDSEDSDEQEEGAVDHSDEEEDEEGHKGHHEHEKTQFPPVCRLGYYQIDNDGTLDRFLLEAVAYSEQPKAVQRKWESDPKLCGADVDGNMYAYHGVARRCLDILGKRKDLFKDNPLIKMTAQGPQMPATPDDTIAPAGGGDTYTMARAAAATLVRSELQVLARAVQHVEDQGGATGKRKPAGGEARARKKKRN